MRMRIAASPAERQMKARASNLRMGGWDRKGPRGNLLKESSSEDQDSPGRSFVPNPRPGPGHADPGRSSGIRSVRPRRKGMRNSVFVGGMSISLALSLVPNLANAATATPECIAPAKPGGGFDLTCRLVRSGLQDGKHIKDPMRVTYMPGGGGAVAYNAIVSQRPGEGNTIVAFSGGSLLNLAQGKFGKYTESDVRWLAAIGRDCGMMVVRADSSIQNLTDLVRAIKKDPTKIVFGVGGTMGGQDWTKAALVAKVAGIDPKAIRYVAFEGGGEAFIALLGGHVQVVSADISEATTRLDDGKIRVLAAFSDQRLPGKLASIPTATEQGFAVSWPDIRGLYMGPRVSDTDYTWWIDTFNRMMATKAFVEKTVHEFSQPAAGFGLVKR